MSRVDLFRQRHVWMPTIYGWIMLMSLGLVLSWFWMRNIYHFLAPTAPVGARVLVVEGWLAPAELDQALRVFKSGNYERIVTTGGPIVGWPELSLRSNYARLAADYLRQNGVRDDVILVVPAPMSAQDRTFLSAVMLRNFAEKSGMKLDAIDLFSSGAHARRSRLLFQMALGPAVRVGVLASTPAEYDPDKWWVSSSGVESIIFQTIGMLWVKCFFWPGPGGSQQELWGE